MMKKLLFSALILFVILISGCITGFTGQTPETTTTVEVITTSTTSLITTSTTSTTTPKFQSTNKLDPNVLVSSEPEDILLQREELNSRWLVKNSWGDYTHKIEYVNASEEKYKVTTMEMEDTVDIFGLYIKVQKYDSIEDASESYAELLNDARNNLRIEKQEVPEVGNERFGALAYNSRGCGWYKIIFRRNNMLVTVFTSQSYFYACPPDEIKEEFQYYSVIIDNKIN